MKIARMIHLEYIRFNESIGIYTEKFYYLSIEPAYSPFPCVIFSVLFGHHQCFASPLSPVRTLNVNISNEMQTIEWDCDCWTENYSAGQLLKNLICVHLVVFWIFFLSGNQARNFRPTYKVSIWFHLFGALSRTSFCVDCKLSYIAAMKWVNEMY